MYTENWVTESQIRHVIGFESFVNHKQYLQLVNGDSTSHVKEHIKMLTKNEIFGEVGCLCNIKHSTSVRVSKLKEGRGERKKH